MASVTTPGEQLGPFLGAWYGASDRSVYTLTGDPARLLWHTRRPGAGQVEQERTVVALDGGSRMDAIGGRWARAELRAGALTITTGTGEDEQQRVKHTLDSDALVVERAQLVNGAWQVDETRYQRTDTKQVLLYRRDLAMRKGKIAAQCAHASMAVFFARHAGHVDALHVPLDGPMAVWSHGRFAKVVLSVEGEAELLRAHDLALAAGLPTAVITDSGRTEFHGVPTRTAMALGPAAREEIDRISGPTGAIATKLA